MFSIDGHVYDVDSVMTSELEQTFEIMNGKNSGRKQNYDMYLEPGATFYNYNITITRRSTSSVQTYDELYDIISDPDNSHTLTMPHNQGYITFSGYIASGGRKLIGEENGKKLWGEMTLQFVAIKPYRRA